MSKKLPIIVVVILLFSLALTSCNPGQAFGPTVTPTVTITPTPTITLTPTPTFTPVPTFTPTVTATPLSKFNTKYMKITAMQVVDIRIDVKGSEVTAIFYLQDVPEELVFQRNGVRENSMEYTWGIYIDTDNDINTGDSGYNGVGTDYALLASNLASVMTEPNLSLPIEKGVQTNVWSLSGNNMSTIADGKIIVDPEANTITLSGTISGITPDSVFFYKVEDQNPAGYPQTAGGKIIDRVTFIK